MESPHLFFSISDENGKLSPEIVDTFIFLKERGFYRRKTEGEIDLFKTEGFILDRSYPTDMVITVSDFLKKEFKQTLTKTIIFDRKGRVDFSYDSKQILERFARYGWGKIFNDSNFTFLPEMNIRIKRHTRDKAFFYFKNGYVEVTRSGKKFFSYDTLVNEYVFKDNLIDRDIQLLDIDDESGHGFAKRGYNFWEFLNRLAGVPEDASKATDGQLSKMKYLMKCIGFMLHDYKEQGLTDFCTIFCDDNAGGTGKGILVQAFREMTTVAELDAKKDERFDPEELTEFTRIKVFNDILPGFQFSTVYNEITDQAVIRHMHKNPRYIEYENGWKTMLTSNHVVRGNTGADLRRQRVFSVNPFFSEKKTPMEVYGHSFFSSQWEQNDWDFFYNIMFECVRLWLFDLKLYYADVEYDRRKMEEEFPGGLREYIDGLVVSIGEKGSHTYALSDLYYSLKTHDRFSKSPFVQKLNSKFFGMKLTEYLTYKQMKFVKNHNRTEITIWK